MELWIRGKGLSIPWDRSEGLTINLALFALHMLAPIPHHERVETRRPYDLARDKQCRSNL
jgi:hypothetical protein